MPMMNLPSSAPPISTMVTRTEFQNSALMRAVLSNSTVA